MKPNQTYDQQKESYFSAVLFVATETDFRTFGYDAGIAARLAQLEITDDCVTVPSILFRAVRDVLTDGGYFVAVHANGVTRYTPDDAEVAGGFDFGFGMSDEFEWSEVELNKRLKQQQGRMWG